jgi:DNA-directed RNA polymerase subunit RPC12/RpoP
MSNLIDGSGPPQMHVNMQEILKNGKSVICTCGNDVFVSQMKAKIISRIALSAPEDVIAQQVYYVCGQCGKAFDVLMDESKKSDGDTSLLV